MCYTENKIHDHFFSDLDKSYTCHARIYRTKFCNNLFTLICGNGKFPCSSDFSDWAKVTCHASVSSRSPSVTLLLLYVYIE